MSGFSNSRRGSTLILVALGMMAVFAWISPGVRLIVGIEALFLAVVLAGHRMLQFKEAQTKGGQP
jgi:hypothetical protein